VGSGVDYRPGRAGAPGGAAINYFRPKSANMEKSAGVAGGGLYS
jgi:hypothetical protein